MATIVEQPVSPPRISLWRRLSKRDALPKLKLKTNDLDHHPSNPETKADTKPVIKLRRRGAQIYKDAPGTSSACMASLHLPLSVQTPSLPTSPTSPSSVSETTTITPPTITPTATTPTPTPATNTDTNTVAESSLNPSTEPTIPKKKKKKETVSILQVQRIHVPVARMKPRIISLHRVLPAEMATTPFPDSPSVRTVAWRVFLRPEQVYNLVMGHCPDSTDDQWFVYSQGPDKTGKLKVHFHRSWTGTKIAELFVVVDWKGEGAGMIVGVKWDADAQANGMDEDEVRYVVSTTCSWVLGVELENGLFSDMQLE